MRIGRFREWRTVSWDGVITWQNNVEEKKTRVTTPVTITLTAF